jgi:hypothetical protein
MSPRSVLAIALVLFTCGFSSLRADEIWTGTSDVKFQGTSTLHDFDGTVPGVPLKVTVAPGKDGRIVSATSNVEVKKMNTADEKRDNAMWAMFQQAKFRFLKVEVSGVSERTLKPPGGKPGSMPITLTIAGKEGAVVAAVTNVVESPTQGSFDLAFPVSLKAFSLEAPKAMGGLIKVGDTVKVNAHIVLKKDSAK